LRTIVATNTCSLYNELAVVLGTALDPYVDVILSNLMRMAGFTKKIVTQTTQATVGIVITNTSPQPRTVVPLFSVVYKKKLLKHVELSFSMLRHTWTFTDRVRKTPSMRLAYSMR